jgi:predicted HTH transcriptional regulator
MTIEHEVVYDIHEPPSQVAQDVVSDIRRGHRRLLRDQNARLARRSLRRARKRNVELLSVLTNEYDLTVEEIKKHVGRDINKINDTLANLCTEMKIAQIEQEGRGDADIERSTLESMVDVMDKMQNFQDLLEGIDSGAANIERSET